MNAKHVRTAGRPSSFAFNLEPGAHAPTEARQQLQARLPGILAPSLIDDVLLLTTELVTNSVRHSPASTDGTVDVGVKLAPDRIRVEVSDPGSGFQHVPQHPGTLSEGGRGLFLVEALSNRWGMNGGEGTTVWFELEVVDQGGEPHSASAAGRPAGAALAASSSLGQVEGGSEPHERDVEAEMLALAADLRALGSANVALQGRARSMEAELGRVSESLRAGAEALRTRQKVVAPPADAPSSG